MPVTDSLSLGQGVEERFSFPQTIRSTFDPALQRRDRELARIATIALSATLKLQNKKK